LVLYGAALAWTLAGWGALAPLPPLASIALMGPPPLELELLLLDALGGPNETLPDGSVGPMSNLPGLAALGFIRTGCS